MERTYDSKKDVLLIGEKDFLSKSTSDLGIQVMGCDSGVRVYYDSHDKMIGIQMIDASHTPMKMWKDIADIGNIPEDICISYELWMVTREYLELKVRVRNVDGEYTAVALDHNIRVHGGKSRADAVGMLLLAMGHAFLEDVNEGKDPFQREPASDNDWYHE
jgi:hypothetical protein